MGNFLGPFLGQAYAAPLDVGGRLWTGFFAVDRVRHVVLAVSWLGVKIGSCSLLDAGVHSTPQGLIQQARAFTASALGAILGSLVYGSLEAAAAPAKIQVRVNPAMRCDGRCGGGKVLAAESDSDASETNEKQS